VDYKLGKTRVNIRATILLCASASTAVKFFIVENILLSHTIHVATAFAVKFTILIVLFSVLYPMLVAKRWILFGYQVAVTIYLVAHIEYFLYFHDIFSLTILSGIANEAAIALSHGFQIHWVSLFAGIDIPIVFAFSRWPYKVPCRSWGMLLLLPLAAILLQGRSQKLVYQRYGKDAQVKTSGLLYYEAHSFLEALATGGKFIAGHDRIAEKKEKLSTVVLIQVETLDARLPFAKWGNTLVMPRMRELSKQCLFFPYVLAYHGVGGSSDADFSMEYSIPANKKIRSLVHFQDKSQALATHLDPTHLTAMFHGNEGQYFGRRQAYMDAGFDAQMFAEELKLPIHGWGNSDGDVFEKMLEWLGQNQCPIYIHCITMSTHEPFQFWKDYYHCGLFRNSPEEDLFTAFHYEDSVLARLIDSLRERPNTWILVIGDHTPSSAAPKYPSCILSIRGNYFEFVPLYIFTPDHRVGMDDSLAHSFLDIAPTVLSAAGAGGSYRSDGEDLTTKNVGIRGIRLSTGDTLDKRFVREEIERCFNRKGKIIFAYPKSSEN
jgi:lipoteichoic acid synthase